MALTVDVLNKNLCPGCSACYNVCPVNAIKLEECGNAGFFEPVIDRDKCINCGLCEKTCPVLHPPYDNDRNPQCFAAMANDELRLDSSSGGMFSVLAQYILDNNGYVCAASLDEDFKLNHIIINSQSELPALRRSKYIQSYVGNSFREIKALLDEDKIVMFTGCPCQVAGLKNFLGKPYDNLLLVDLVCHGAPSQKVFQKYIEETYGKNNLKDFKFRTKKYGYVSFTQTATLKTGEEIGRDISFDYFEKIMHSGMGLKDICGDCIFAETPRQGDITIGDFWGITKYNSQLNDNKGTSLVLLNNSKGLEFFSKIKKHLKKQEAVPFEVARTNNRFGRRLNLPKERRWFFTMIKNQPFNKAANYSLNRKFNVGVIGLWYGRNYGSMVTYYALHYVLTQRLYQSVLMIENCLAPPAGEISKTSPRLIAKKYYDISAKYSVDDLSKLNNHCDAYIVGSDQLWNVYLSRPYKQTYFLGFADERNKKIAYGTSFGIPYCGNSREKMISQHNLKRFDAISVRDTMSKQICENEFGLANVTQVCDPSFLCPVEEYSKLASQSNLSISEKYILAYILDPEPKFAKVLNAISKKYGCKIKVILNELPNIWESNKQELAADKFDNIEVLSDVDLYEWLYYYEHAQSVITDSFHGTIFSIIFQKPFATKINVKRGAERFTSLLQPLGLENRLMENLDITTISNLIDRIDYHNANEKVKLITDASYEWLKTNLLEKE